METYNVDVHLAVSRPVDNGASVDAVDVDLAVTVEAESAEVAAMVACAEAGTEVIKALEIPPEVWGQVMARRLREGLRELTSKLVGGKG